MAPDPQPSASPTPPHCDRVEPIVWLLFAATFICVGLLVAISKWSPNDGQTFQVIAGLATGFGGSLLTRVKLPESKDPKAGKQ